MRRDRTATPRAARHERSAAPQTAPSRDRARRTPSRPRGAAPNRAPRGWPGSSRRRARTRNPPCRGGLPEAAGMAIFLDVCTSPATVARLRRPWFENEPIDETFFDSAPVKLSDTFAVARAAAEVWDELTADGTLWWCRILDDVTWTSPRPFGVGTTRTVKSLKGANTIREHYFRWEEGRQKSFYVVEASGPLFKRFAEDYLVEPETERSCRFTWTIAYEPRAAMRPGRALNDRILRTLFTDTRKHYA